MNNKLNLIFSAMFFIAGGAILLNPGIFRFLFTTASWITTYMFFFLCSVYLGIKYVRKAPIAEQKKFFDASLAYLLVLISSFAFMISMMALSNLAL